MIASTKQIKKGAFRSSPSFAPEGATRAFRVPRATARSLLKTGTLDRFPGVRNPWTFGQYLFGTGFRASPFISFAFADATKGLSDRPLETFDSGMKAKESRNERMIGLTGVYHKNIIGFSE